MSFDNRVLALQNILGQSPYFEYLYRNAKEIGFKFSNECEVLILDYDEGYATIKTLKTCEGIEPELWVEIDEEELVQYIERGEPLSKISISTSNRGQVLHPTIERIIQRIFMPPKDKKYLLSDRVELIYGGLFDFCEPKVIWRSKKSDLSVLKYNKVFNGLDVYITSGFTNSDLCNSKIEIENKRVSGYGYELIIFTEPDDVILGKELIGWAEYIEETNNHIYQGQYLEYSNNVILGTNLSGFFVLNPLEFPEYIPICDGFGKLNMLLGVTSKELQIAKEQDIYEIADRLLEKGYINFSPINRESIV